MIKNASIATLAMFLSAASPAMATNVAHSLYVNLELALNQTTVGTVIRSISEQTGYEFSYDETLLNKKISKVFVNLKNEHIENVLQEVFKNTGISYKIVNNRVFLKDDTSKRNAHSEPIVTAIQQQKKKNLGYYRRRYRFTGYWREYCTERWGRSRYDNEYRRGIYVGRNSGWSYFARLLYRIFGPGNISDER